MLHYVLSFFLLASVIAKKPVRKVEISQFTTSTGHLRKKEAIEVDGIKLFGEHVIVNKNDVVLFSTGAKHDTFDDIEIDGVDTDDMSITTQITASLTIDEILNIIGTNNEWGLDMDNLQDLTYELVLFNTDDHATDNYMLSYNVRFFTVGDSNQPYEVHYIIDGNKGDIYISTARNGFFPADYSDPGQQEQEYNGGDYDGTWIQGNTRVNGIGGNEKMGQSNFNNMGLNSYPDMVNNFVRVLDANNQPSRFFNPPYECTGGVGGLCNDDAINGAFGVAGDAYYYGNLIFNLYQEYLGIYPISSLPYDLIVHYGDEYENAFSTGSALYFGDGKNTFYPLVSVDVVGHEMAHSYTTEQSNLVYSNESGGMNEAYSDLIGEMLENYFQGSNDWLVGYQIFKSQNGALRYMMNPPEDGKSIDQYSNYYDGLNVHYSSGLYNKIFYLLNTQYDYNIGTIFIIFSNANRYYWAATEKFASGLCWSAVACSDLLGDRDRCFNNFEDAGKQVGIQMEVGCQETYDNAIKLDLKNDIKIDIEINKINKVEKMFGKKIQ